MEIKFKADTVSCLQPIICQAQSQEQTQEVRISEAMPDIGRVLCSWGQVLLRSKEWRGDGMSVSGGVQVWVWYLPEDGSDIRSVETWIPFQMKWNFPQTQRDGAICATPLLKSVDARSTSSRKLMVRTNVSILAEALEPVEPEIYTPDGLPEDIQLLKRSYPIELPREAGEKVFTVEQEYPLPEGLTASGQILCCSAEPKVAEYKVMAGRLVFRGDGRLKLIYRAEDEIKTFEAELPFSQFTELDRDHSGSATAKNCVVMTDLDTQIGEDGLLSVKASMADQYVIYDRVMVDAVEDAYSLGRPLETRMEEVRLPIILDTREENVHICQSIPVEARKVVYASCLCQQPEYYSDEQAVTVAAQFQVVYQDAEGNLQYATAKEEASWPFQSEEGNRICASVRPSGGVQVISSAEALEVCADAAVCAKVFSNAGLSMVSGIEIGQMEEPAENRPSLILRRAGEDTLWDIAKECGTTVEAICKANQIQQEPESDKMLLIPIP